MKSFAIVGLCLAVLLSFAGCGGDDDNAAPLRLADRLLTVSDTPGYTVAREFTWNDVAGVVNDGLGTTTIQASDEEVASVLNDAGFKAGTARVFERSDASPPNDLVVVIALQLASAKDAQSIVDFSADDSEKPCPESCAFKVTKTKVKSIPGSRSMERIATADSIAETGVSDVPPTEVHRTEFKDGEFFYFVETITTPPAADLGSKTSDLASTLYKRVKGAAAAD